MYAQVAEFRQLLNNISVTRTDHRVPLNEMLSGSDLINFGRDEESGVDQQNNQSINLIHNNNLPAIEGNVSDSIQRGSVPAYPVVFPNPSNSGNLANKSLVFTTIEVVHPLSRIGKDVGLLTSDNVSDVLKFMETLVNLVDQARVLAVSEQDVMRLLLSVKTRHLYNAVLKAIQNNNSVDDMVLHQFVTIRLRSEWMMMYYNRT